MEDGDAKPNGIKSKKGKEIALDEDYEEDSDDDSEDMGMDMEQFVVCTLDTERVRLHPFFGTRTCRPLILTHPSEL